MPKDKKEAKRLYDIDYRRENKDRIKKLKAERYQRDKHKYTEREQAYRQRPDVKKKHRECCSRPEYVARKRVYDVVNRCMRNYGEYWESAILVTQLEREVRKRIPKNQRLGYRANVMRATKRNNQKRLEKAIASIENGECGSEILTGRWLEESREILKSLLCE